MVRYGRDTLGLDVFAIGEHHRSDFIASAPVVLLAAIAARTKRITIEGHTDERGGREYNLALGQKRAEAVKQRLMLLGAAPGGAAGQTNHGQTWVPIDDTACWIFTYSWNPDRPLSEPDCAILHGHGTGALKHALREALSASPYVGTFRPGDRHEGGDAVTVVVFRR